MSTVRLYSPISVPFSSTLSSRIKYVDSDEVASQSVSQAGDKSGSDRHSRSLQDPEYTVTWIKSGRAESQAEARTPTRPPASKVYQTPGAGSLTSTRSKKSPFSRLHKATVSGDSGVADRAVAPKLDPISSLCASWQSSFAGTVASSNVSAKVPTSSGAELEIYCCTKSL